MREIEIQLHDEEKPLHSNGILIDISNEMLKITTDDFLSICQ